MKDHFWTKSVIFLAFLSSLFSMLVAATISSSLVRDQLESGFTFYLSLSSLACLFLLFAEALEWAKWNGNWHWTFSRWPVYICLLARTLWIMLIVAFAVRTLFEIGAIYAWYGVVQVPAMFVVFFIWISLHNSFMWVVNFTLLRRG